MKRVAFPASASQQGYAFEHLILSYYERHTQSKVTEWSSYLHGASGKWYQCDGIVEDNADRWLVEAKFFADRPATRRDIKPKRREQAAIDLNCTGIRYISLNGFDDSMCSYVHDKSLNIEYLKWDDIRAGVLSSVDSYASALLDGFVFENSVAQSTITNSSIKFDALSPVTFSPDHPEFAVFPDSVERWLRRMPKLELQRVQTSQGEFRYHEPLETVSLVSTRLSDLSLEEAWQVEDALSGYSARVYSAVKATARAMIAADGGFVQDVQSSVHALGWKTGTAGIRSSLDNLVLLGLLRKERDGRKVRYFLTPMGRAYVASGQPDDIFFAQVLLSWPPYSWLHRALDKQGVSATPIAVVDYFRAQYAPYEPYAKCLFNQNKADGLVKLYKIFG